MSAITAKASRKMKKYAVLTREPRCFLGSFDFSWEQRKFEEIAVRSSVICSDANLPRVEYEDIVSGTGRLNKDIYAKESSKSGIAFHQGDVLYGKLRPYLQNWLLPAFDGLAVGDFWVLQPQNADSSFLYRLIQSRQFDEVANQSTGTKMPRADWKLVSKTVFSIPSNICEQAAIGTYFTALDNLITLHQRECISFTGRAGSLILTANKKRTTSSWEQRKLGEVSESYSGGTPSVGVKEYYGGKIPFIRSAEINSEITELFLTEEGLKNSSARLVGVGDILYALYGATSGEVGRARLKGAINQAILAIKPHTGYDSGYLAQWLRKSKHSIIETYLQGGQGNLSGTIVKELSVDFPLLKEQQAIGDFFSRLDNLITLHQRKPFLMKWRTSDANRNQTNRLVL